MGNAYSKIKKRPRGEIMTMYNVNIEDKMLETLIYMIKKATLSENVDYYQIEEYVLIKKHLEKEQLRNIEETRQSNGV